MEKKKLHEKAPVDKPATIVAPSVVEEGDNLNVDAFIQSLPEDKRAMATRMIVGFAESKIYRGPIPPPEYLEAYEKIVPGSAKEILDMARKQQEHRMSCERIIIDHDIRVENRGQWMGLGLGGLCIAGSFFTACLGYTSLASLFAVPALLGVISVFVLKQIPDLFKKRDDKRDDSSEDIE